MMDSILFEGLISTLMQAIKGSKKKPSAQTKQKRKTPRKPKKMSLRKERTWDRVDKVQQQIDEILQELGKKQTISVAKIVEMNNRRSMPVMMKHAVVAIEKKLRRITTENRNQRFVGAHNIAFWAFRRYGYIRKNGFDMTGRGLIRNKMHQTEDGGGHKTSSYARMYNTVFINRSSKPDTYRHKKHPTIKG